MILVTGSTGYLGGRIADHFEKKGHVISRGLKKNEKRLSSSEIKLNLTNIDDIEKSCKNISTIIHLAALNQSDSEKNNKKAIEINYLGTKYLYDAAIKNKVKNFIFFSTAHIYGKNLINNVTELTVPNPILNYAKTKFMAEQHFLEKESSDKINTFILRLSNIIGSPIDTNKKNWSLVSNDFCYQAIKNNMIILNTDGSQKRDFYSLEDLLCTIENIVNKENYINKLNLFNLGSGNSISIKNLAIMIKSICKENFDRDIKLFFGDKKENLNELLYDVEKIKSTGLYCSKNTIEKSIIETLNFCLNNKF